MIEPEKNSTKKSQWQKHHLATGFDAEVVKVLERRRKNAGLSIPQFAVRAGVGRNTIYTLLAGNRKGSLTLSELIRYATALGVTPLRILREAGARFLNETELPPVAPMTRRVERGPVVPGSSTLKPPPRRSRRP